MKKDASKELTWKTFLKPVLFGFLGYVAIRVLFEVMDAVWGIDDVMRESEATVPVLTTIIIGGTAISFLFVLFMFVKTLREYRASRR